MEKYRKELVRINKIEDTLGAVGAIVIMLLMTLSLFEMVSMTAFATTTFVFLLIYGVVSVICGKKRNYIYKVLMS